MKTTNKLQLHVFEGEDDILDTDVVEIFTKMSENMERLDSVYEERIKNIESDLEVGKNYPISYKVWNSFPSVGTVMGWINIREGVFAKEWVAEKTYKVGDIIIPTEDNGHFYECVSSGVTNSVEPTFLTSKDSVTEDRKGSNKWNPTENYEIGDLVVSTDGDTVYFYKCVVAGLTNSSEPLWVKTAGSSTYDGSVVWLTVKTVQWKEVGASCLFRPFGEVY